MNSLWLDSVSQNESFSSLSENKKSQVCIIGAGIFGLTCAYYLSKVGYQVIVLEKDDIGKKATVILQLKSLVNMDFFMII